MNQLVPQVIWLPHLPLTRDVTPPINPQGHIPPGVKKQPHYALSPMDSRLMVDHNWEKVHL
jgi:hypothetical protein